MNPGKASSRVRTVRADLAWMDHALCRQVGPNDTAFYPNKGESSRAGKSLCNGHRHRDPDATPNRPACPVRSSCLAYAMTTGQQFGVWGGLSEIERRTLLAKKASK